MCELLKRWPLKIKNLGFARSGSITDHLDKWTKLLFKTTGLVSLNLSQVPISAVACKNIGDCLVLGEHLRNLDISNCRLNTQGSRFIINGMIRNRGL